MPQDSGMKTSRQRQDEEEARSAKAFGEAVQRVKGSEMKDSAKIRAARESAEADENLEKDPVGPIKARARATARAQASKAPGGNIFTPDDGENYGIRDRAPQDR